MVTTQQIPGLIPQVLAQGTPEELRNLDILDTLYQEGDMGELQLFLTSDIPLAEAQRALDNLEEALQEQGVVPWPGRTRIGEIEGHTVRLLFVKRFGLPGILVLVLVAAVSAIVARFPGPVIAALRAVGIDASPDAVRAIAGAVAVITGLIALRGLPLFSLIPMSLFMVGGLLLFIYLAGWRALKWVAEQALGVLEKLGLDPKKLLMGLAVGAVSMVLLGLGVQKAFR